MLVPTHEAVRSLIIVALEQRDLWRSLVHEFKQVEQIEVLLDRRHGKRQVCRLYRRIPYWVPRQKGRAVAVEGASSSSQGRQPHSQRTA
jgi:hypothetical protein